ncbi:MAG: peptide chain release factor N(5)-glutamine methyltransferase [Clostridia bacterium]|nr:peptide chain release factor N(5)-glutamine methyltransferase [Clostridia bacterium]
MSKKEKTEKIKKPKKCGTYIGGQAVLEGVMMMGKSGMATAVRDPDGEIQIEAQRIVKSDAAKTVAKIPFVRGIVNLVSSLVRGTKTLMRSATVYGNGEDGDEPGKVENWVMQKFKVSLMDIVTVISVCLGVILAVALFFFLPNYLVGLLQKAFPDALVYSDLNGLWTGLILGGIKFIIFLGYLGAILLLKDIRRLYQYHGAEHKTINAYEHGVELTPEKVTECSRIHDRCGTSFLFIVLLINVIVFSVVSWACRVNMISNGPLRVLARLGLEIVLLPVIAGISYEILKLLAKFDNKFVNIFKAPGMLLQKYLTTREPTEDMIEVAIAAFNKVLEMDADETSPESQFVTGGILSKMLDATKKKFAAEDIDESDAEWIYALVLKIHRSDLYTVERTVSSYESKKIAEIIQKRLTGRPLWYIIGDTEFYGCTIKVDERALIPRPETEMLADIVIKSVENGDKVLDMCTGSGCIAIAVSKACKKRGVSVTAADISDAAIMLAKENANYNSADVSFVVSDLFENVHGRYNIIVCNPPYIKSGDIPFLQREVREHEPRIALDGGEDGLEFYRQISKNVKNYLTRDGMLIMECGENQATDILKIFPKRDYAIVLKDLNGVERFLKIVF